MGRSYICLSTAAANRYLILDSDLKECASFYIADELEVPIHVFSKSKGLVRGGNNGQIAITTFDEWVPKSTTRVVQCLKEKITCLSTRDGLIVAGSDTGEVGGWSYDGTQLYQFQIPDHYDIEGISFRQDSFIEGISIRQDSFLITTYQSVSVYKALSCGVSDTTMPTCIKTHKAFCDWATYDIEGKKIYLAKNSKEFAFRPILPISTGQHKIFILSVPNVSNEIIIRDFNTLETLRKEQVDKEFLRDVAYMWCNYEQLFLIRNDTVYLMDLGKDLVGYSKAEPFEVAECFALIREIRDE